MWLLVPFVVLPIVEIALFLKVGDLIGFWPTIGLVILSAVAGSALMRRQGAAAMADLQGAFRELRDPTGPLAHGALILLAGALMVTPGFFSDSVGLALLVPAVRRWVIRRLGARMRMTRVGFGMGAGLQGAPQRGPADWPGGRGDAGGRGRGAVVDAAFTVVTPEPPDAGGPQDPQDPSQDPPRPGPRPRSGWTRH